MMYLDWFAGTMKKIFNIEVKRADVGYEAYDFYHEEIDDLLIPAEHLVKLPRGTKEQVHRPSVSCPSFL
ncbi:hypothetical protein [Cytobacillus oceanisediminis]|uniref:hypothetical protein n=1 Tax=Cytobacillus oceanisediminis TaxID=665099 RepID=UPI003735ABD9